MTDWRQIQARIRKAKNSPDATTKLLELFQRTRDAMVAWELGAIEEKAERTTEAAKWYTIAAQRFRRSEWKTKAEEALTRLGVELPLATDAEAIADGNNSNVEGSPHTMSETQANELSSTISAAGSDESGSKDDPDSEEQETAAPTAKQDATANSVSVEKKKRRRGRRGGRGRRRKEAVVAPSVSSRPAAEAIEPRVAPPALRESVQHREPRLPSVQRHRFEPAPSEPPQELPSAARVEMPALQFPSERTAHGRSGDPALASRMAQLESMLRRLVASPLRRLDEADKAPAGPGVFLLSDSDQTSSYYIEACQTLRVGLGNLTRGNRGGKSPHGRGGFSEAGVKAKLAEHLGIHESKVSQYLKDHCVVRWLQMDDDAPFLAHFAVAILRTPLNLD
jgi:hypothetical protein